MSVSASKVTAALNSAMPRYNLLEFHLDSVALDRIEFITISNHLAASPGLYS